MATSMAHGLQRRQGESAHTRQGDFISWSWAATVSAARPSAHCFQSHSSWRVCQRSSRPSFCFDPLGARSKLWNETLKTFRNMAIFSRISPKNLEFHLKFPVLFCVTWFFFFKAMDKTQTIRQLGQFFLFFLLVPSDSPKKTLSGNSITKITDMMPNFYHYNDIVSVVPLIFFHVSTNVYEGCVRSTPENEKIKFWTRLLKATVDTVGAWRRDQVSGRWHEDDNTLDLSEVRETRLVLNDNLSHTLSSP